MKKLLIGFALFSLAAGCASRQAVDEVRLLSWNLGHFSRGTSLESTIPAAQASAFAASYRTFVSQADVVCLCEYNEAFVSNGTHRASACVFGDFAKTIGPAKGAMQNAIMTRRFPIMDRRTKFFSQHYEDAYYVALKLNVAGVPVWFVQTHLDSRIYLQGHFKDRERQMQELIEDFKDEENVVLCGTFNVGIRIPGSKCFPAPEEYRTFEKAGYLLANVNGTGTYPTDDPLQPVDNVIVKGVGISDVHFVSPGDLSDHFAIACKLSVYR